ncbi:hypothetical protein [Desulfocicer niacini]
MKIEIKIEADKEALERIQKQLGAVASGVNNVVKFFEQFEFSLKNRSESKVVEQSPENLSGAADKTISEQETVTEQETPSDEPGDTNSAPDSVPVAASSVKTVVTDTNIPSSDGDDISPAKPKIVPKKKSGPAKTVTRKTRKTPKAGTVKKSKPRVTAQDMVLRHIKKSKNGLDSTLLQAKTGFSAKKVADAVYQLKKKGLIEKKEKGLFVLL